MDEFTNLAPLGEADPVPQTLLLDYPEQAKTLLLLHEVSRELTSILDREELLRRVAQRVKKLVDYDVFSVMLWNEQSQHLESAFSMRYEDAIPARLRLPLYCGLTGTAAGERRVLRVNDTLKDSRYIKCEAGLDTRSELVVPLLLKDRLIGVLDLESTDANAFTAEHERMLSTLGSYIAIALENASLYEAARDSQLRLQADLDTAREVQRQLLPAGAREIPGLDLAAGYCPARELGGDFYDFLPYGEAKLGLALGDVSGKGTAAALYGSLATGMLRELVVDHASDPGEMLATLNHRLLSSRLDARFIAMVFAVYDASNRSLMLSNAGNPYPLLVREGVVTEIRVGGVPLGLLSGMQYDETSIDLKPDDIVLFASDGILEAENAKGEQYGLEQLSDLLKSLTPDITAAQISELILDATDRYSGTSTAPHDDRTLLVLRVTNESVSDYAKLPIIY